MNPFRVNLSCSSVGTYRTRVMQKLGTTTLPDLIKFAIKTNLISLD